MFCRGDLASITELMAAFTKFSKASGLEANLQKSNIYMGGVLNDTISVVENIVKIPKGEFPFRYLGVPLSTKKLSYATCKPLIKKIMARTKVRAAKLLSYAGKDSLSRKALVSWEQTCFPKTGGGLNFTNLEIWKNQLLLNIFGPLL